MTTVTEHKLPGGQTMKISVVEESPRDVLKAYGSLIAKNAQLPLTAGTSRQKGELAREAAAIFAKDIENHPLISGMSMEQAVKAADFEDPAGNLGLLSGSLVLNRALPLMQYEYPVLSAVTTDFSDAPGLLNQTENTQIVLTPPVQTYDPTTDSSGRPKGWTTVSPARTVDVPVKLDEYVGVPIVFGASLLAATVRKLFQETAPQAIYALGGYVVNKLTALFTAANYNAYAATSLTGGATSEDSETVTVASTANAYPGVSISGTGIPTGAFVRKVVDATTLILSAPATATNSGLTLTIGGGKVPHTYPTYARAVADFSMADLDLIGGAFDQHEVPQQGRFVLLNGAYYRKLRSDPSLNLFFAATQMPEIVTKGHLPELTGFMPYKAPYFPTSSNRVGFAGHKAAAILKTRLPLDLMGTTDARPPGSVTTVSAPNTGLSLTLVQYVNLTSNYAEWRPEIMLGAAVGERRAGLVLTSQ